MLLIDVLQLCFPSQNPLSQKLVYVISKPGVLKLFGHANSEALGVVMVVSLSSQHRD